MVVVVGSIAAAAGKVGPIEDNFNQKSGLADKHFVVPKSLTRILQQHGEETPWDTTYNPPVPGAIAGRDPKGNILAWRYPDGSQHPATQPQQQTQTPQQPQGSRADQFVQSLRNQ